MKERRESPRRPVSEPCELTIDRRRLLVTIENLSDRGCLVHVSQPGEGAVSDADLGEEAVFVISSVRPARRYTGEIIRRYYANGADHFALRFWKKYEELPTDAAAAAG